MKSGMLDQDLSHAWNCVVPWMKDSFCNSGSSFSENFPCSQRTTIFVNFKANFKELLPGQCTAIVQKPNSTQKPCC